MRNLTSPRFGNGLIVFSFFLIPFLSNGQNLLTNPEFENDFTGWQITTNSVITTNEACGSKAGWTQNSNPLAEIYQHVDGVTGNDYALDLTAYRQDDDNSGTNRIGLYFIDYVDDNNYTIVDQDEIELTNGSYSDFNFNLTNFPANANKVMVGGYSTNTEKIKMDCFELTTTYDCPDNFANAGSDQTICNNANTTLCATGGIEFEWSTGAMTQCIGVNPGTTTTYTVTVTDANGCEDTDQVTVFVESCGECDDTLVEYGFGESCNDDDDSFSPENIASCLSDATELYPYNGSSGASCANGIICVASTQNGWELILTAAQNYQMSFIKANFLYPVEYGTAGGSGNDDDCPNTFEYKVRFYVNGSLVHTHIGNVPQDQFTLETIAPDNPILLTTGDLLKIKIDGTTNDNDCDLFEIGGLSVHGCCGTESWLFDCDDNQRVDVYGAGTDFCGNNPDAIVTIPDLSTVYQTFVEVVFKGQNPGNSVEVTDNNNVDYTLQETYVSSFDAHVYSGMLPGNISSVEVNSVDGTCSSNSDLQSIVAYAFRNVTQSVASTGFFTSEDGYNDVVNFSIDIPTDVVPRDITVSLPVSELTTDGRYLKADVEAGGATGSTVICGPDPSLNQCCLDIIEIIVPNVPGAADEVNVTIDTRNGFGHDYGCSSDNGQSWVMAGTVKVDINCGCPLVSIGPDQDICLGESTSLTASVTGGTPPYSYAWSSGQSTQTINVSPETTTFYIVTVSDNTGCESVDLAKVIVNPALTDGGEIAEDEENCEPYDPDEIYSVSDAEGDGLCQEGEQDCCAGDDKIKAITLIYTGEGCDATNTIQPEDKWDCSGDPNDDTNVYIIANDDNNPNSGDIWFNGTVNLGASFTIDAANDGQSKLSSATFVHIFDQQGGNLLQSVEFHTSCSQPIAVGDQFGANLIIEIVFEDGTVCGDSSSFDCCESGDKIKAINLTYTGEDCSATTTSQPSDKWDCSGDPNDDTNVYIVANDDNNPNNGDVWFAGSVALGSDFTIDATNAGETKLSSATFIHIFNFQGGSVLQTVEFHTSCSQPLSEGDQFGANLINEIIFEDGSSCGDISGGNQDCCENGGDPEIIEMLYTGDGCGATSTQQPNDKWSCNGDPGGDPNVYIIANDDDNPNNGDIWFSGNVALNGTYSIDAGNAGESKLSSATFVHIFDQQGGTLLQSVEFHTSCSQPLGAGDQYGANLIVSILLDNGNNCEINPGITYQWETDNGSNQSNWATIPGATDTSYDPPFISQTTCYRRKAISCCGFLYSNIVCKVVNPGLTVNVNSPSMCPEDDVTLTATPSGGTPNYNYLWSNNATTQSIVVSPNSSQSYSVTVTDAEGCSGSSSGFVTVYDSPDADAGPDANICVGQIVTLTASGGVSCFWDQGLGAGCSKNVNPVTTTTYTVTVTDTNGCTDTDQVTVFVHPNPSCAAGNNGPLCVGQTLQLTASSDIGDTYSWSGPLGYSSNAQNPSIANITQAQAGTYTVTVTDTPTGCTSVCSTTVVVNPNPSCAAGNNGPLCVGQTLQLTASSDIGDTYSWSGPLGYSSNAQNPSIANITQAQAGTYTVTVTDTPTGCTSVCSTTVVVNPNPSCNAGNNGPLCVGQTLQLTASSDIGDTYSWSGPLGYSSNAQNPSIANITQAHAGTYTVTVTDTPTGCTSVCSTTVVVNPNPSCNAGNNGPLCVGQTLQLTASSDIGDTYSWSGPLGYSSNAQNPSIANITQAHAGTYTVTVTDTPTGCTSVCSTTVVVNPNPSCNAGNNGPLCVGQTLQLTASSDIGDTYSWSGPLGYSSNAQNPSIANITQAHAGTYTVTVTDTPTGCTSVCSTTVVVNPNPSCTADNNGPLCVGQTLQLTASSDIGDTYSWSGPLGYSSNAQNPSIANITQAHAGLYTVTVTDTPTGCTSVCSTTVVVNPNPSCNAGNNGPLCVGQTLQLTASSNIGDTYSWSGPLGYSSNAQNPTIPNVGLANTGTYTVTVTDAPTGCSSVCSTFVIINPNPSCTAGNNGPLCVGQTLQLTASSDIGNSYSWSGPLGFASNQQNPSIPNVNLANTGVYTVTVTNTVTGCFSVCSTFVLVNPNPSVTIVEQVIDCFDNESTLTAVTNAANPLFLWSGPGIVSGQGTAQITVNQPGTYTVQVTDQTTGCFASDSKTISADECITHDKMLSSITQTGPRDWTVVYTITVDNYGVTPGDYDLADTPGFENDIEINSASYSSSNPPGLGGNLSLTNGIENILGNDVSIAAGGQHVYTLTYTVSMDLTNANSPGDEFYLACGTLFGGDNPTPGEGLYNKSSLDIDNDGEYDEEDEVCGDLPYITHTKVISSITETGLNTYDVVYTIEVTNNGGVAGSYNLQDAPDFDDDISINSAGYASTAPGNAGGALAGNGPWNLAIDQGIGSGATHVYTLTVNVTIDLSAGSSGNNVYTACEASQTGDPQPGEGLFNESRLDVNDDGQFDEYDEACGDLPYIVHDKYVIAVNQVGAHTYDVLYGISVQNLGGAQGVYGLDDAPDFDDDISINGASYVSTAPGNAGGALAGNGPWVLANGQLIGAGGTHNYTLTVNVTIDLSAGSGGDNVYTECESSTPGDPTGGEGLYNRSLLDANDDGTPDEEDEVCEDLPYVTHDKTVFSVTQTGANSYDVVYQIEVENLGGVAGEYNLTDAPDFDDDISINGASYVSTAPGNAGGALAGNGPWTLATDQGIGSGATHVYTLTVSVTLDLSPGSGGDNVYSDCESETPGDPTGGEGLYNRSLLDVNDDGQPDEEDEVCEDLPNITHTKVISSITETGLNTYDVVYTIEVTNNGGVAGSYNLQDAPDFDDDISINSAGYASTAPGNAGGALAGNGPWNLAIDQGIGSGATHVYTLTVNVTIDLSAGSSGNNVYTACETSQTGDPQPGEGLFNESRLDVNDDGQFDEYDEACGDLPYIVHDKYVIAVNQVGAHTYNVLYGISVQNLGGALGVYGLDDAPDFDDDISINGASYVSTAPGNAGGALAGNGPWVLANGQLIGAGGTHNYTLTVNVTIDLSAGSGGDNVYTECESSTPGDPTGGEGLYNRSLLDANDDGTPDEEDEVCEDLPYVTHDKTVFSVTQTGANSYDVVYQIEVENLGGVAGEYNLTDAPDFDDDISINGASYVSTAPGNAGGALAGNGPWTLATDQGIGSGATHVYTLTVSVTLDLSPGSGGDNVYSDCESETPGDPTGGEGLYNRSLLDVNDDGQPDEEDEVCEDLPNITHTKVISSITETGLNTYDVVYTIEVTNNGGVAGSYNLQDAPDFDDDISINSAGYASTAPGNAGGALAGNGPWNLAIDQGIGSGATHVYTLTVNVTLDLSAGSSGNNVYTACETSQTGDPQPGEGLFNESRLDVNDDGQFDEYDEACGDLPYIVHDKYVIAVNQVGAHTYNVLYGISVQNLGGALGVYGLDDAPDFDDDISINGASYVSTAPGNAGGALAGNGPWVLANGQLIGAGGTHNYTLTVNVTIDLSAGSGGDNVYTECESSTPGDPTGGEGLYNRSLLDANDDGTPDEEDEVCEDLPYVTHDKTVFSVTQTGANSYDVVYQIEVENLGGVAGEYNLTDAPDFDDDISINGASYVSTAPGNAGGALAGNGPWTLATDQGIGSGATHVYTLTVSVTLDLSPGSGGDNVYSDCESETPGDPTGGEGLYNRSLLDVNDDGQPDEEDEVCEDLPNITHTKVISSITETGLNTYDVVYTIEVTNNGGVAGSYNLQDAPDFDDDISINSAGYASTAPGNAGGALAGNGPWNLAIDQGIGSGATHVYTLTVNVTLDLSAGSSGNNVYTACETSQTGDPQPGEGLFNESRLDVNDDGQFDEYDEACGDLPYIVHDKYVIAVNQVGAHTYDVLYGISVQNLGGAQGVYGLDDAPDFDDDISINGASYVSTAPGNAGGALAGNGPWVLANGQLIGAGGTHNYTLTVNVTIDLSAGSGGDNVYTECESSTPGDPTGGEGLYNRSLLDANDDGTPDEEDEVCEDLPYVTHDKTVFSVTQTGANSYDVVYQIEVENLGGIAGEYNLTDAPDFDDDISINGASYVSTAPGNAGGALAGNGPWTLATDQGIGSGATHVYTLTVSVTLDLSPGSGGDNVYSDCESETPGDPTGGEGLYNRSLLDVNDDGQPDEEDEVCEDIPLTPDIDIEKYTNGEDADNPPGVGILVPFSGATVEWTYVVTNTGQRDLVNVVVTDDQEGLVCVIPFLAVGESHTCILTDDAQLGPYANEATAVGQPVDSNGDPIGDTVEDDDPSHYVGIWINVEKQADQTEVCPGETVNYSLTVRILGGTDGVQFRNVMVEDTNLPGSLDINSPYFVTSSDLNSNGYLDFIDLNNDGISDEEFVFEYSLVIEETTLNEAMDMADVYLMDQFIGVAMNIDDWLVEANPELCPTAAIGDKVWHDLDGDGEQDNGEPGIPDVVVNLYNGDMEFVATMMTDEFGMYLFEDLFPGDYYLEFESPEGYELTFVNQGGNDELDNDVDGSKGPGTTPVTTLEGDEVDLSWDAGYYICAEIGDFVWYDTNENDIQDPEENGINGLRVELYRWVEGELLLWDYQYTGHKPGTPSDDGYFNFCVAPGDYFLYFDLPPYGLVPVIPFAGPSDQLDSNVDDTNGPNTTETFTVYSGDSFNDIDAGYYPMAVVGDRVWMDSNNNGIQDQGEEGMENIQVQVFRVSGDLVDEQLTDSDGEYTIDYLQKDNYYLKFNIPGNLSFATADAGNDDTMDSDVNHAMGPKTTGIYYLNPGDDVPSIDCGLILGVVPIYLSDFWGEHRGDHNFLEWSTSSEIESDLFVIERRHESESTFSSIGQQVAAGFSLSESVYSWIDEDIYRRGSYYYRIKSVDKNGAFDYSRVVVLKVEKPLANSIRLYPNPVMEDLFVELIVSDDTELSVDIYDATGKLIRTEIISEQITSGKTERKIDVADLSAGVYLVRVITGRTTSEHQIIVLDR